MPVDDVASRPSAPPQPPPEPAQQADSTDSAPSSGNANASAAAAPSPELTKQRNADAFGAANDNLQAAKLGAPTSARNPLTDRFADRFESAGTSTRGANPAQPQQQPNAAAAGAAPGAPPAQARGNPQPLGNPQRPEQRPVDPQQRQRVEDQITRRLRERGITGDARDIADRLARRLGNGDMRRGMEALDRALQRGRLGLGLAGIHGLGGGPRNEQELKDLQAAMGSATGGPVDAVLDNTNGRGPAVRGEANPGQLEALTEVANLGAMLGLPVDVVSHSNGFNALRTFLERNPGAHLGNITLVNPNIPPNYADTQRAFQAMVGQSDRVKLITTRSDEAVPWSGAGSNGHGDVWQQQVHAAAMAGVRDITVLSTAHHSVESVAQHLNRGGDGLNLDFAWDPQQGRAVPKDPEAWRRAGYTWSPEHGFQRIPPRRRAPIAA